MVPLCGPRGRTGSRTRLGVLLLALLVGVALSSTARACEFTFFPNTVRSPQGIKQMTTQLEGKVVTDYFEDPVSARKGFKWEFVGKMLQPINPRLCRYLVTRNDRPELYFPATDIDRVPLSPDHGLPEVRCMVDEQTPGRPVAYFPLFGRGGALTDPNSESARFPLCGDLFFFKKGTRLHFSGTIDAGLIRILECQAGMQRFQNDYVMLPVFQADCTKLPVAPSYESVNNDAVRG